MDQHFRNYLKLLLVPLSLAAVFLLDIIGPFEPVVSVLYIPIIIVAARIFRRPGIVYVGVVCIVLTTVSYVLAHIEGFDSETLRQYGAIVATVVVTTSLMVSLHLRRPDSLI